MSWRHLRTIVTQECVSAWRDRVVASTTLLALMLGLASLAGGTARYRAVELDRLAAEEADRASWLEQETKDAHNAAHFGGFAVKQVSPLSVLEPGLDPFTGVMVRVEAHRQNDAMFAAARSGGSIQRFGLLTPALTLQALVPLLVVFLGFAAISRERETGTLALLLSQGVSPFTLVCAKFLALGVMAWAIAVPVILAAGVMLVVQPTALSPDHVVRLAVWAALHLIYLLVVAALVLTVSASARSSRGALVTLLAGWVVVVLLLPKASANVGVAAAALPARAEFEAAMRRDLAEGIDGHNPDRERREAIEGEALTRYGVSRVEDLPVNIDGLLLEAGEAYSTLVYERHITALRAAIQRQNQLTDRLTLINPYAAVRTLSISVAGTDYADHTAFQDAAENYRRTLVTAMNHWITVNTTSGGRRASAPVTLWSTVPPFAYSGLDCLDALRSRPTAVAGLVVAVAAAAAGLAVGARRMRVV